MQLFWHLQFCELQIRELPGLQPQKLKDVKPEFYDRNCTYFTSKGGFLQRVIAVECRIAKDVFILFLFAGTRDKWSKMHRF